jgi:hypothetical protein
VAAYHEAHLSELVTHVAAAIDRFRDGDLDAFDVDRVLFHTRVLPERAMIRTCGWPSAG